MFQREMEQSSSKSQIDKSRTTVCGLHGKQCEQHNARWSSKKFRFKFEKRKSFKPFNCLSRSPSLSL